MRAKKLGSGLSARMAVGPTDAVAAGMAAALGQEMPLSGAAEAAKADVVAINIRLPKAMHRTLRRIAFDEETSINALLIAAAERMLTER